METHRSDIVSSLHGRDAGGLYLVVGEEDKFLFIANGRDRRAERPKKKNRLHVRHEGTYDGVLRAKLLETGRLTNSDIRNALAQWAGEQQPLDKGGKTNGKR